MSDGESSDDDDLMVLEGTSWLSVGKALDADALCRKIRTIKGERCVGDGPGGGGIPKHSPVTPAVAEQPAAMGTAVASNAAGASGAGASSHRPLEKPKHAEEARDASPPSNVAAPAAEPTAEAEAEPEADVAITGGSAFQGALNDFPHARNLCANLPLRSGAPPASTCPNCFCAVCEIPAPCDRWGTGDDPSEDHCCADVTVPAWKAALEKRRKEAGGAGGAAGGGRAAFNMDAPPPAPEEEEEEEEEDVKEQDLSHIMDGLRDAEATDEADVPAGALKVTLMKHQRRALAWGLKKESNPDHRGGILADDQGLGKTVSTLAIIVSAPPPDDGAGQMRRRRILRDRGPLGRDRGGQRVHREAFRRGSAGAGDAGAPAGEAPAAPAPVLPHLPSCVCKDCKLLRKEKRREKSAELQKRNAALAFGDSDDEDGQRAREKHRRKEALRIATEGLRPGTTARREDGGAPSSRVGVGRGIGGVGPNKVPARTLIVCPAIVLQQWKDEVEEKSNLRAVIYHGSARKHLDEETLLAHDVVITTYGTCCGEFRVSQRDGGDVGTLFNITWWRVVLDEAHIIRNRRTHSSLAMCALQASKRWCLTGTPLMNGADDVYPLFRFLRYQPFASWPHFRGTISNPCKRVRNQQRAVEGMASLRIALQAVTLRRTKQDTIDGRPIVDLPPRTVAIREVEMDEAERDFYHALEENTVTMFDTFVKKGFQANYMHILVLLLKLRQACDHPMILKEARAGNGAGDAGGNDGEFPTRDQLLVALGAARVNELEKSIEEEAQCPICFDVVEQPVSTGPCGHGPMCGTCLQAALLANQNATGADQGSCPICRNPVDDGEGGGGVLRLDSLVAAVASRRDDDLEGSDKEEEDEARAAVARVLARAYAAGRVRAGGVKNEGQIAPGGDDENGDEPDEIANSAKITAVLDELAVIRDAAPEGEQPEQTVVFSQFTSFLDILGPKIAAEGHSTLRLDGSQAMPARARIIQEFRRGEASVLLVSLKAASLGLNLNCASRIILVDPWWNAAIEDQAIDRCHRIGQTREVKVVRLLVRDTVENRIAALQDKKRAISVAALGTGADSIRAMRQRLSLRDLQDLFGRRRPVGAADGLEDEGIRCRCQPGRCVNCLCVSLDTKCSPSCRCGGVCANGDLGDVVLPFGRAPPAPRVKRE